VGEMCGELPLFLKPILLSNAAWIKQSANDGRDQYQFADVSIP